MRNSLHATRRWHGRFARETWAGCPCHDAFTLIEVVVALAMTVMVSAILSSAIYTIFHAKDSINDALAVARSGDDAVDLLAQELTSALPPTPTPSSLQANVTGLGSALTNDPNRLIGDFQGLADNSAGVPLDFFTSGPEPKADMQPDVREVQYDLVADPKDAGGGNMLVRRAFNVLPVDNSQVPPDQILLHHVTSFKLSYFDGTSWYDTWNSVAMQNTLPFAVRFTIELAPEQRAGISGQPRIIDRYVPLDCGVAAQTSTMGGLP